MSVDGGASAVPAGWYPDPADAARLRRWDGQNWTADVSFSQPSAPVVVPSAPVFAEPAPPRVVPQAMPTAPHSPPPMPPSAQPPTTVVEPPGGPVAVPDWAHLPGLTLPPDLSSIPGLAGDSVLPLPRFEDPSRQLNMPQPERAQYTGPSEPYAPPPAGVQYTAPAPPGVAYTPPPPGVAFPASALGMPPMTPLPSASAPYDAPIAPPRFGAAPAGGGRYVGNSPSLPSSNEYVPMVRSSGVTLGVTEATGSSTAAVWLIGVLPLLHFAAIYVVFGALAEPLIPGIQWGVLAAPAIFSLIFAAADRRKLVDKGHGQLPSVVLAVIPPLYLLVRCFTVGWRSIFPLLVWIILQVAAVAGVIMLLPTVLAAVIAGV